METLESQHCYYFLVKKKGVTGCDIVVYRMSSITIHLEDKCIEQRRKTL